MGTQLQSGHQRCEEYFRRRMARAVLVFLFASIALSSISWAETLPELISLELLDREQFEPAVHEQIHAAYEKARNKPRDAEAAGRLGMILQAYGKYTLAARCYQRAKALAPRAFPWAYYLANVQGWLGQHDDAIQQIHEALHIDPESLVARLRLAQLLFESGDIQHSAEAYQQLINRKPTLASAHFGLGQIQAARGEWVAAIQSYRRACEISDNYAAAHYALAMAYRKAGEMDKAREQLERYQQAKLQPQPSDDPLTAAVNALYAGGLSGFAKGSQLLQQGKLREAAAEFEEVLKENPRLVMAHTNLIAVYGQLGESGKAEQHFKAAIETDPAWVEAYHNWGMFQLGQGKTAEAIEAFREAVRINPNYADAQAELGMLLEQMGHGDEAMRHYRRALESNPAHRQAHYLLGRRLMRTGHFQDAIEHLLETIQVEDEKTPLCMQTLAVAYEHAGNAQDAVHYLAEGRTRALSLGKKDLAAEFQNELDRLKSQAPPR